MKTSKILLMIAAVISSILVFTGCAEDVYTETVYYEPDVEIVSEYNSYTDSYTSEDTILAEENEDAETPDEVKVQPEITETYRFRNNKLLSEHYEKHGVEMGFASKESYEAAASEVINNPTALFKYEAEDGDGVYYVEETNEFVILSGDGYIRTYFYPSAGKAYFDRQ